jgi:calpain-15
MEKDLNKIKSLKQEVDDLGLQGFSIYLGLLKKTSNKQNQEKIRRIHEQECKKFIDPQFPPDSTSLAKDFKRLEYDTEQEWKTFVFKDIDDIYPQPIKVFNDISPNDILQGRLGDCYFLSTLSAMAEFPKLIERCFDTQDYQPSGCYSVNIYETGVLTTFIIDDLFPCTQDGELAFSGPRVEKGVTEIWVLLLEKAWAKRFGSYYSIDTGATEDALRDLTGAPCKTIEVGEDKLWESLFEANFKNYIITAGSSGEDGCGDLVNEMGLVSLHAYAIIDIREVKTGKKNEKLLKIRNPWGGTEWTGDWSDSSPLWTKELKQELGWEAKDDGSFWMSFKDFCHYFFGVTICMVNPQFHYQALLKTQKKDDFAVFKVTFEKTGEAFFTVTHEDFRKFDQEDLDYSPVRAVVCKKTPEGIQRVTGFGNAFARDTSLRLDVQAGEYLVYVEVMWNSNLTDRFGFSVYSNSPASLSDDSFQQVNFLENVFVAEIALKQGKKKEILPGILYYEIVFDDENKETGLFLEGIYLDAFVNTASVEMNLQAVHKTFKNMEILGKFKGSDSYKFKLKPGEVFSVIKKKKDLTGSASAPVSLKKL